ncbi:hypothetical protein DFP72DRAFT_970008 [Ephemerocybe angulata]|uniref:Uncharacterized protein n=1 Tax=Ephemerocybe angulata TaxID=980116 RepID=A0A8H6M0C4_9AGAR|nr:hypothetical protein DFP72DRAFT_970008 [Tulosesus angulatus]
MPEMSAVYLHNSLYNQEAIEGRPNFPHSRNLSTVSSATLQTSTTLHEPLLPYNNRGAPQESYFDVRSRNTRPDLTGHDNPFGDKTIVQDERQGFLSSLRRRPLSGMRWLKIGLDVVIGAWALYNAIRYFLAFTIYRSASGETVALALGICAGLSFAFLSCAIAFSAFRAKLLQHGISYATISTVYWSLTYLSLLFLFAPAAANLAFVFAWRNASDVQLRPRLRCGVDIDIVWSTTERVCKTDTAAWGVWVAVSSLRLAITSAVFLGYQFVLYKLSRTPDLLAQRFRGKHRVNPSDVWSGSQTVLTPPGAGGVPFPSAPSALVQSQPGNPSTSSLSSRTKYSTTHRQLTRSRSSGLYAEAQGSSIGGSAGGLPAVLEDDGVVGFSERFTALISEIERETEAGLDFARSEESASKHTGDLSEEEEEVEDQLQYTRRRLDTDDQNANDGDEDDNDDFYGGARRVAPALGFNEFGQPYPPDQDYPMMNGYVRRMPTIESMGSREIGSSVGGSSILGMRGGDVDKRGSMQTNKSLSLSRPGTRNGNARGSWGMYSDFSFAGSEPPSRANSLSAQVERLAAMGVLGGGGSGSSSGHTSEMGELGEGVTSVRRVSRGRTKTPDSPLGKEVFGLGVPGGGYADSTGGSRSTELSYFTATTGSAKSKMPVDGVEEEVPPIPTVTSSGFSMSTGSTVAPPPPPKDIL